MSGWILIGVSVGVLWALWLMCNTVVDLFAYWYAARRGEDLSTTKEREQS